MLKHEMLKHASPRDDFLPLCLEDDDIPRRLLRKYAGADAEGHRRADAAVRALPQGHPLLRFLGWCETQLASGTREAQAQLLSEYAVAWDDGLVAERRSRMSEEALALVRAASERALDELHECKRTSRQLQRELRQQSSALKEVQAEAARVSAARLEVDPSRPPPRQAPAAASDLVSGGLAFISLPRQLRKVGAAQHETIMASQVS